MRDRLVFRGAVVLAFASCSIAFAQDRFIDCRKFDKSVQITIDGDGSDWPLSSYGSPAAIDGNKELTTGDHFALDPDTALYENFDSGNEYEGREDFDTKTYIGWDDKAFYLLNIARDSEIGFEHANANTIDEDGYFTGQSVGWTSDGIELWFDNDNDRLPPSILEGELDNDMQFDVLIDDALQRRDFPGIPKDDMGLTPNLYYQYKAIFYTTADYNDDGDLEYEVLSAIDTATKLDTDNKGYTMEIRIPFGTFNQFESAHPIGFDISWLDWDNGQASHFIWNGYGAAEIPQYKEMRFTSDRPLGGVQVTWWELY
jgi:hypothetical protein